MYPTFVSDPYFVVSVQVRKVSVRIPNSFSAIFIMYKSTISSRVDADISVSLLKIGYYFISYLLFVFISNMNSAHVAHFITATVQSSFVSFDFPISHDI